MNERHPLLHPVSLAAIAALVVNDHVLKAAYPGWWTGKLSDLAGMVFFPLLLAAVWECAAPGDARSHAASGNACPRTSRRSIVLAAAIATGLAFSLIQVWPPASDAYRAGLAALQWPLRAGLALATRGGVPEIGRVGLAADPTDLLALPALALPIWLARRHGISHRLDA